MNVFEGLKLLGGLCLFLFGMYVMGQSLEHRAGGRLRHLLGRLTGSRWRSFCTGLLVTAIIQSSSATTVMVVGFVSAGMITLRQSIGVIMGANLGTTVTAWLISMGGISGESVWLQLLRPSSFTPILAFVGIILLLGSKDERRRDTAMILLGFATLISGMETMTAAVKDWGESPAFRAVFVWFSHPLAGVLVGAILTAILQSSSASVGILQALSATGQITYAAAVPIIIGQNIGTCVTALISSVGATLNARRAALVHLLFNTLGAAVWLTVFILISWGLQPPILQTGATAAGIAASHSIFNLLSTLLLLPLSGRLERWAVTLTSEK